MKKETIKGFVVGIITATVMATVTSSAYDTARIVVDGKEINPTDANGKSVSAIVIDGTTYLPVRAVANAFGKAVYWDGETSTVYLGTYNGNLEYPTTKLVDMTNVGSGWFKTSNLTDNYGNYYSNALEDQYNCTGQYILNGKYSRLRGTVYVSEGTTTDGTAGFIITADGKDIYTATGITKTSSPIYIDVSVEGCNILEITNTGERYLYLHFGDAGLYQ